MRSFRRMSLIWAFSVHCGTNRRKRRTLIGGNSPFGLVQLARSIELASHNELLRVLYIRAQDACHAWIRLQHLFKYRHLRLKVSHSTKLKNNNDIKNSTLSINWEKAPELYSLYDCGRRLCGVKDSQLIMIFFLIFRRSYCNKSCRVFKLWHKQIPT